MIDYLKINKDSWNNKVETHFLSDLYDMEGFIKGRNSLTPIEMDLLGDVKGKSILHLQCHFGQDSISLGRMGANVTGVDLSDVSIRKGKDLIEFTKTPVRFICSDIYDLPNVLDDKFDIVFTSFGTINWLPDLGKWAEVITHFLKPGGQFFFAEFHPVIWMYDEDFTHLEYNYLNSGPIVETEKGTYADRKAQISQESVVWNHGIAEVIDSLVKSGLLINAMEEFDYSPINCFNNSWEDGTGKFRIRRLGRKIPMSYTLSASQP